MNRLESEGVNGAQQGAVGLGQMSAASAPQIE
jgi:hypothetical protein